MNFKYKGVAGSVVKCKLKISKGQQVWHSKDM